MTGYLTSGPYCYASDHIQYVLKMIIYMLMYFISLNFSIYSIVYTIIQIYAEEENG